MFNPHKPKLEFLATIGGYMAAGAVSGWLSQGDTSAANAATAGQSRLADTQAKISMEQWDRYKDVYAPLEEEMVEDVRNLPAPDYQGAKDRATADVVQAYSKATGMLGRNMARMGMNPGSGAGLDRLQQGGLEFTKADIHGRNASRLQEDEKAYRNLQAKGGVASIGAGLPSSALQGLSGASAGYGRVANYHAQSAAGTGQFIGDMAGRLIDKFADGGEVRGPGTGTSDSINGVIQSPDGQAAPAQLSDGEYVVPADVVRAKGTEFFDRLIDKHHAPVNRGLPMMRGA